MTVLNFHPSRQSDEEVARHIEGWCDKAMNCFAAELGALSEINADGRSAAVAESIRRLKVELEIGVEFSRSHRNAARERSGL